MIAKANPLPFDTWLTELRSDAFRRGLGNALGNVSEGVLRGLWRDGAPPTITGITNQYARARMKPAPDARPIGG